LIRPVSALGLGRVKTRRYLIAIEEVIRLRPFERLIRKHIRLRNRTEECHSRRVSIFCVFTQPGSISEAGQRPGQVRSSPNNRHGATASGCRFRARFGHRDLARGGPFRACPRTDIQRRLLHVRFAPKAVNQERGSDSNYSFALTGERPRKLETNFSIVTNLASI
jgi:hypothetical protein